MTIDETELRLAWERAVGRTRASQRAFESLLARHREPHRRYHGVRHVVWVVRHVHELAAFEPVADLDAVVVAACFHDAVHRARQTSTDDTTRDDATSDEAASDEAASAAVAERELSDLDDPAWATDRIGRVATMIRATAHVGGPAPTRSNRSADHGDQDDDDHGDHDHGDHDHGDTAVLLDADLAVLGSPPNAYQSYVNGVRAEHAHLDDLVWRRGRRAVLEAFLTRPTIYRTPTASGWWESRARANLAAELAALAS